MLRQTSTMGVSWKASVPITAVPTWPVMAIKGMLSSLASAMAVTRFVAPGPAGGHADAHLAGATGVALGGEPAPLLVPRQDDPNPVPESGQRLVQRDAGPARVGKNRVHAVVDQRTESRCRAAGHSAGGDFLAGIGTRLVSNCFQGNSLGYD